MLPPAVGGSVALMVYIPGPPLAPPAVAGAVITPLPAPLPPRHSNLPLVPEATRSIDSVECEASVRIPGLLSLTMNRYVLPCSPCSCRLCVALQPLVPSTRGVSLASPDSSSDPPLGLGKLEPEPLAPLFELEHPMAHADIAATSSEAAREPAGLRE